MNKGALVRVAYLEFKITKQISTGCGDAFLAQGSRAPAGFVREELGFGIGAGPSLMETLSCLETANARRRADFEMREGKLIKFKPAAKTRSKRMDIQKAIRRLAMRAGVKLRAGGVSR